MYAELNSRHQKRDRWALDSQHVARVCGGRYSPHSGSQPIPAAGNEEPPSPEAQSMLFGYFELKAMSAVVPAIKPSGEDGRWF